MVYKEESSNYTEEIYGTSEIDSQSESDTAFSDQYSIALAASTTMTSHPTVSLATSKTANGPPQLPSPSQSQAPSIPSHDGYSQRRSGGSGSFGAGANTRYTPSTSRSNQSFRKQNKDQRRPRLGDEDTAAESVGQCLNLLCGG